MVNETKNQLKSLLVEFLHILFEITYKNNSYNKIIECNIIFHPYEKDAEHLIAYKEQHGHYPVEFELLFNQWLLSK